MMQQLPREQWMREALEQFEAVMHSSAGFRPRSGQQRMAQQVAHTFSQADVGASDDDATEQLQTPQRAIAVIEAGTGVGKSLAYCVPAIHIALARGTRVLISTATVALQEQLVHKDLPQLATHLGQPFAFALAKGRGRYVCQLKLERWASGGAGDADEDDAYAPHDLFTPQVQEQRQHQRAKVQAQTALDPQARVQFYAQLADALERNQWNGDRDELSPPPSPLLWAAIAAESSGCTGRHCPKFEQCSYFERRKELVRAHVIVANHDLLLSSIGARLLPDLDNCLLVLDEAHRLPATALSQFACEMDLSRLTWLDQLASRALRALHAVALEDQAVSDIAQHAVRLRVAMQDVSRLILDLYGEPLQAPRAGQSSSSSSSSSYWHVGAQPTRVCIEEDTLPAPLQEPLEHIALHADAFLHALRAIGKALRNQLRDAPQEAQHLAQLYAQVGSLAPRLEGVHACAQLLLQPTPEGGAPIAKWMTLALEGEFLVLRAHASPVIPGQTLRQRLWASTRAAVLTSATLTSCGQFDFFLHESGLHDDGAVTTLQVPSPFDYPLQGRLIVAPTQAEPRQAQAYTAQMVHALLCDLTQVQSGALVLFTSREQMRLAVQELPGDIRPIVLIQNQLPRHLLLAQHRERVAQGLPSIIFGLQSFGEGLDLPGRQCEWLFISKLPFAPPDDPVGQTRARWLRRSGHDPFSALVVPATAMRLAQWVGRAIRTEDDHAQVLCYDKRLTQTSYGQRLLKGLPPFKLEQR